MDAETHDNPPGEQKKERHWHPVGIRWSEGTLWHLAGLHTTAQEYRSDIFGGCVQCMTRFICMIFVADLIACKLDFS